MFRNNSFLIVIILLLLSVDSCIFAQQKRESRVQYQARTTEVDKKIGNGAQRLLGDVVFTHEGAKMYCDSAYFYPKKNALDAYRNIYIVQGDTLQLYGDFLHYEGKTRLAEITGKVVKLINKETTLTTNELDFNLGTNVGYYTTHGVIINEENKLESEIGHYYTNQESFHFSDSVVIYTPDYTIYSDTLHYNTGTGLATFLGPTNIIGDSSHMYCEKGWYDSKKKLTEARKNAWADNLKQIVKGNYIFYNQNTGDGTARDNVEILDKEQNIILRGNDAKYNDISQYAFMTDSARFIQVADFDSLYLHADSIITYPDTSGEKILFAYYHVKFFRYNVQGLCDSMVYTFIDSVAHLFGSPVLWTENKQISADNIDMYTKNQQMERMYLTKNSFIVNYKGEDYYDQIKGKNMVCYFKDNQLQLIDVKGNGQTVYYAEDGPDIVGVNNIECTDMAIHFEEGQVRNINFYVNPVGVLYPLDQAPENELILKGFNWRETDRPKTKEDIY